MKNFKWMSLTLLPTLVLGILSACGNELTKPNLNTTNAQQPEESGGSEGPKDKVVLKLAHTGALEDVMHKAALKFSDIVKERSDGRIDVQVFGASQLGNDRDIAEGLQLGTIDMSLLSNGSLSTFEPMAGLWDLPYLFKDLDHAHAVARSEIGQKLKDKFDAIGLHTLSINDGGFRHLTNSSRPIREIKDLDGIKIRVMESAIMKATFDAIPGMSATPVPFGELYSALEQGVVDAQENPVTILDSTKFYEVQDYLSLSGHFYYPRYFFINKDVFDRFSKEDQKILEEASEEASQFNNEQNVALEGQLLKALEEHGMEINEVSDEFKQQFLDIMLEKVYPAFYQQIGGGSAEEGKKIIEDIRSLAK